jgi:hypothetical protein
MPSTCCFTGILPRALTAVLLYFGHTTGFGLGGFWRTRLRRVAVRDPDIGFSTIRSEIVRRGVMWLARCNVYPCVRKKIIGTLTLSISNSNYRYLKSFGYNSTSVAAPKSTL